MAKDWVNFHEVQTPILLMLQFNMSFNNHCIQNQQTLHLTQQLSCIVQGCTCHFAFASTSTLHVHRRYHTSNTSQEHTLPSPTASNGWAELRNLSSSPPVHPHNPLFEELEDYNLSQPCLWPNIASSSTLVHHIATPLSSPISINRKSTPVNAENSSPSQLTSQSQVHTNDDLQEQIMSILDSMFEECINIAVAWHHVVLCCTP